jgi:hypothetical protein
MASTKYTVNDPLLGGATEVVLDDAELAYDQQGNRTVDHTLLDVGDKLYPSRCCPGAEITAKETT